MALNASINTLSKMDISSLDTNLIKKIINSGDYLFLNDLMAQKEFNKELFDLFWEKCSWEMRHRLISNAIMNEDIVQWLSDDQIEQILEQNDLRILQWLSLEIYTFMYPGEYTKVNISKVRRCSKSVLHKLIKHLVKHSDPEIRENLRIAAQQKYTYDDNPWMLNGLDC